MSDQNPVFIPGPTNIPEVLRRACDLPTIDHRSEAFADIFVPARQAAQAVMKCETGEVVIFPATGTGAWEASISNTLSPGDRVLAARHGMFSHRWIDMCQRFGLDVEVVNETWGNPLPVAEFSRILTADTDHRIRAVLATHNETATGVTSDIAALRAALDAAGHPALLMVDGVSSIGSMDFRMEEWGVDLAVTGSQKGFMLPPGLAIVGISQKALGHIDQARLPRTFFDFRDMLNSHAAGGYPYTPPVGLLNGLACSGRMLLDEGLETVFARHRHIANGVRAAVDAWGLSLCAREPASRSDTVTAIMAPAGFDAAAVVSRAADTYGMAFGAGLGDVAGKVFRIGHLGSLSEPMMLSGIATIEMVMADLGYPITLGSGVAAAQRTYSRPAHRAAAA